MLGFELEPLSSEGKQTPCQAVKYIEKQKKITKVLTQNNNVNMNNSSYSRLLRPNTRKLLNSIESLSSLNSTHILFYNSLFLKWISIDGTISKYVTFHMFAKIDVNRQIWK